MKFSLALVAAVASAGLASATSPSVEDFLQFPADRNLRSLSSDGLPFDADSIVKYYERGAFGWNSVKTILDGVCQYYTGKECWPTQSARRMAGVCLRSSAFGQRAV